MTSRQNEKSRLGERRLSKCLAISTDQIEIMQRYIDSFVVRLRQALRLEFHGGRKYAAGKNQRAK
jgi:hypothetical protein